MTMYIVPQPGIELVDWSIDRGHPTPVSKRKDSNETLYFVYYSHGIKPDKPWQFYLDFKVQVNQKGLNACIYTCMCTCSVCLHVPVLYFIKIQSSNTHKTCVCMPVLCYTQMAKFYPRPLKIFAFTVPVYLTIFCRWRRKQTWLQKLPCVVTISMVTSTSHHCFSGSWTAFLIGQFQIPGSWPTTYTNFNSTAKYSVMFNSAS